MVSGNASCNTPINCCQGPVAEFCEFQLIWVLQERAGHPHPSTDMHSSVDRPSASSGKRGFQQRPGWEDRLFIFPKVLWGQLSEAFPQCSPRPAQNNAKLRLARATVGDRFRILLHFYLSPKGRTSKEMSLHVGVTVVQRIWLIHSLDKHLSYCARQMLRERCLSNSLQLSGGGSCGNLSLRNSMKVLGKKKLFCSFITTHPFTHSNYKGFHC